MSRRVRTDDIAKKTFRGNSNRQGGWLLPFCLFYLAMGTTLMMSELDRVVLLSRLFQRVIEREQMLAEVARDLSLIQQNSSLGNDLTPVAGGVNQGDAVWEVLPSRSSVMLPVLELETGRCEQDNQLQVLTVTGRGQSRADVWSVYGCEWFQSGEQVVFYIPQSHW